LHAGTGAVPPEHCWSGRGYGKSQRLRRDSGNLHGLYRHCHYGEGDSGADLAGANRNRAGGNLDKAEARAVLDDVLTLSGETGTRES
jgi:hypothetical protein